MENSPSYLGLRLSTLAVMVFLLSTVHLQLTGANTTCDPVQLSWCLHDIVSYLPPSAKCCQKLKTQESCLCEEMSDPTFGGYLCLPGAKMVADKCGVIFNCNSVMCVTGYKSMYPTV